jgi:hypothetical protein
MISRPLDAHETIVTAVREAIEKTGSSETGLEGLAR